MILLPILAMHLKILILEWRFLLEQLMNGYPDLMLQLQVSIRKKLKLLYHKVLQIKQATVQMFL